MSRIPRVAVMTAGMGPAHRPIRPRPQEGVKMDPFLFTEQVLPSRQASLTPRLVAKMVKMFGWDLKPGYDAYIWLDASLTFRSHQGAQWFLTELGDYDIVTFTHWQPTIHAEAVSLARELAKPCPYVTARYGGEDLAGLLALLEADKTYKDNLFMCGGAFCYRPTPQIQAAMKEWWYLVTRYHSLDQLSMPYAMRHCRVKVLHMDIYKNPQLRWLRPLKDSCAQVTRRWLPAKPE